MRRLLLLAATLGALVVVSPAVAETGDAGDTIDAPRLPIPDVSNPPPTGDSRHVCVIHDGLDWYRCVYVPMP